ncbi:MAG: DUF3810 domain-containing protein [Clostridium sp.]
MRIYLLLLFPLTLIINYVAGLNPSFIEKYYSTTINRFTIEILSFITNFIPFSMYEITIITAAIAFIGYFIYTIFCICRHKSTLKIGVANFLLNCGVILSVAYFLFIILWGLNYNRVPLYEGMKMTNEKHTVNDLGELYEYLIDKTNALREETDIDADNIATVKGGYQSVLNRASIGYEIASKEFSVLEGTFGTPKKLLFSEFFNYTGITGIYFPYTAQAGVNINAPLMTVPATTLHEMAHQRGFAREDEANFIAFLVSTMHPDKNFQYSGYILALSNTGNALYSEDPELYKELSLKKSQGVEEDRQYRIDFWDKYSGKIEQVSSKVNNTYLKSNGVSDGEKSYGRMVDLLLDYYITFIK